MAKTISFEALDMVDQACTDVAALEKARNRAFDALKANRTGGAQ